MDMKTFFFIRRTGEKGSIEAASISEAIEKLETVFGLDVIKIEEMEELK